MAVVFAGTSAWWDIVSRDEIRTGDAFDGEREAAAAVAELDLDDGESWVARVTERYPEIRPGDYVCCQGIGSDVIFVRS